MALRQANALTQLALGQPFVLSGLPYAGGDIRDSDAHLYVFTYLSDFSYV
jgi:hypothetical protein